MSKKEQDSTKRKDGKPSFSILFLYLKTNIVTESIAHLQESSASHGSNSVRMAASCTVGVE